MSSTVSTSPVVQPPVVLGSMKPRKTHRRASSAHSSHHETVNNDDEKTELLSVSWNQDNGCFTAGTNKGFRIYNCDPFMPMIEGDVIGRFGIVEMLFRCNVIGLVGGAANSEHPPNRVVIWDDYQKKSLQEMSFRTAVRAVKLRHDMVVVVLEYSVHVYEKIGLRRKINTVSNPRGLCALSHHSDNCVLACLGTCRGQVQVMHFGLNVGRPIYAHDSHIAYLSLTLDGILLATASTKGTLIRIFNTIDGTRLQEVRRGSDRAEIYSIAISQNVQWLAVSSDKGTVHVFKLRVTVGANQHAAAAQAPRIGDENYGRLGDALVPSDIGANNSSFLSFMRGVLPKYFSSEWSFAQFHLPEGIRYITAFGAHNTVMILGMDGSFYRCSFDPVNGGEMLQQELVHFLEARQQRPRPSSSG